MTFVKLGDIAGAAAHVMKDTESPIEAMMLKALMRSSKFTLVTQGEATGEGYFIYPQKEVGPYRADFIIKAIGYGVTRVWPPNKSLEIAIECDGEAFHTSGVQLEHDQKRDAYFKERGIRTFRFTGSEIYRAGDLIASDLAAHLHNELWHQ